MATTTNFGWETPDDTDLVKDGALAMRTLGNAIDTSLVDLKGGTTGQVLSKTSNTDMDFTWVTSDDANAIQNAIVDAKGDLITATAADTPARLAVGSNGDTLVADSAATTGLRWSGTPSASNPIINSSFQVWQRGTTFTVGNGYTADRWYAYSPSGGRTITRQTTGDTTNLPNIQYCARVARDSGNSATGDVQFYNVFESVNSIPLAGKTITLSFYARRGANYAPTTANALEARVASGTGTDQNPVNSWTGTSDFIQSNVTLTTTWQRFTLTGTMPTTGTQLFVMFRPGGNAYTGTAGAADYFEVTGIQLDIGSVALPFRTNGGTLQGELAACQRYYYRATGTQAYTCLSHLGSAESTTLIRFTLPVPTQMRVAPTSVDFATLTSSRDGLNSGNAISAIALSGYIGKDAIQLSATVTGATQYSPYYIYTNNSAAGYVGVSAEL